MDLLYIIFPINYLSKSNRITYWTALVISATSRLWLVPVVYLYLIWTLSLYNWRKVWTTVQCTNTCLYKSIERWNNARKIEHRIIHQNLHIKTPWPAHFWFFRRIRCSAAPIFLNFLTHESKSITFISAENLLSETVLTHIHLNCSTQAFYFKIERKFYNHWSCRLTL